VVLVDTSVWIEVFRRPTRLILASVTDLEEVVTCLPVVQEVLQGFRDERAFGVARDAMLAFPIVESPLRWEVFDEAIRLYRAARRAGYTMRSRRCRLSTFAPSRCRDNNAGLAYPPMKGSNFSKSAA
jgi:predicted nucleic acid-binding protein